MKTAAGLIIFKRINNNIRYLLLQASNGIKHWTPPKGYCNKERLEDAALRETQEETGLLSTDLVVNWDFKKHLKYIAWGEEKLTVYWLAELKNADKAIQLSDEHQDFKWLSLKDACEIAKFDDMQCLLRDADHFIQNSNQQDHFSPLPSAQPSGVSDSTGWCGLWLAVLL